jgi:hypothetical protein
MGGIDLGTIREKLAQLQSLDVSCQVFGAEKHRYQLGPCLTETEVRAFEAKHQVKLPDDYREFLLEMGNGGAGPGHGLNALDHVIDWEYGPLNSPFRVETCGSPVDKPASGMLVLGDKGCGYTNVLVVTGDSRGMVWEEISGGGEFHPTGYDYLSWYDRWLNEWLFPGHLTCWIAGDILGLAPALKRFPKSRPLET